MDPRALFDILNRRFNLADLHNLCFDCGWDVDGIGTNHFIKPTFLRELIQYATRHTALEELMATAARRNSILIFDGKTLSERNGADVTVAYEVAPVIVDPRVVEKQAIIESLQQRKGSAIYEALIYLLNEK